jgi:hypothetical protein
MSRTPLDFVENQGQWDSSVKFTALKETKAARFERDAIRLYPDAGKQTAFGLVFEGAPKDATVVGEGKRSGYYNFFFGNDPAKWHSRVAAYASVLYDKLYEGVDVRVRKAGEHLEYDLMLAPQSDLEQVVVRVDGPSALKVTSDGSLILHTSYEPLRQAPPRTWGVLPNGETRDIESRFRKIDAQRCYAPVAPRA